MNDRYNSSKQTIMARLNPYQRNINVVPIGSQSGYELKQEPEPSFEDGKVVARMQVMLSLLSSVRVAEFGCIFLKLEKYGALEDHVITLSNKKSTMTTSWDHPYVGVSLKKWSITLFFSLVIHHPLGSFLLRSLSKGDALLVLEPDPGFATVLANDARLIGVYVVFVTIAVTEEKPFGNFNRLIIHPSGPD